MKSKMAPKVQQAKAGHAMYEDEAGVKKNRMWWNHWADRHQYIVEQVSQDIVLIRDSIKLTLIKKLTKV